MRPRRAIQVAIFLLIVLALELCISGRQQSQTFDEADHIFAGYRYWKCLDFSANPEHPPMLKLLAAVPLLTLDLQTPPLCSVSRNDFLDARTFLYSNDADSILFRTRLFASLFTLALAVLLFGAGLTIFGPEVAVLALAIFVFEPTILAHGFLVTTDMAVTCCLFASVVAFYFYLEKRSTRWLVATGIATGMTLAAKHSGLLVIPILTALAAVDVFSGRTEFAGDQNAPSTKRFAWIARSSLAILLIAYVTLWCFYGFRFKSASPPANDFVAAGQLASDSSVDRNAHSRLLRTALRMHILPEPYLYGLRHVAAIARTGGPAFIFGKLYPSGRWYYFPAVLLVKWTVGFILLLAASSLGISGLKPQNRRALWFLALPPLIFLAACLPAKLNLGVRHILPVFPFVIVIAAAGAWELCRHRPAAKYVVAALVLAHAASSMASFPSYIPYSNELFGGTSHTYRVLGESNVDWGQSLKAIRDYVQENSVKDCWVAYITSAEPDYYHSGCKLLPSVEGWISRDDMTGPAVEGTAFVGTWELAAPDDVNPYAQFKHAEPIANIAGSVLVFRGHFDLPMAFALARINRAANLSAQEHFAEAVRMAQNAVATSPAYFPAHAALARALKANRQNEDARQEYQQALTLARAVNPEYHEREILQLEQERASQ